jgi:hypothetical protein
MINLKNFESKKYSQNGEDGILEKIFKTIGTTNKFYVEFGVEDGSECNSRLLKEKKWSGIWMDIDGFPDTHKINKTKNKFYKQYIYADNILPLFSKYNVPKNLDFLSVDIDYNDFYVLHKILTKYRPRVICVEFNCHVKCRDNIAVYTSNYYWDRTNYYNAGIVPYQKLCNKFGYDLIYCDKNVVNLFLIDRKLKHGDKFINSNKPRKLLSDCNFGIKYKSGKIVNRHKDDYNNRKYVNFDLAIKPNTVCCLDKINKIIISELEKSSDLVKLYIQTTHAKNYVENTKIVNTLTRKICPKVKKYKTFSPYVKTMVLNNLIIRFRETEFRK